MNWEDASALEGEFFERSRVCRAETAGGRKDKLAGKKAGILTQMRWVVATEEMRYGRGRSGSRLGLVKVSDVLWFFE